MQLGQDVETESEKDYDTLFRDACTYSPVPLPTSPVCKYFCVCVHDIQLYILILAAGGFFPPLSPTLFFFWLPCKATWWKSSSLHTPKDVGM